MRTQIAIFVDVGYVCALGSMAMTGEGEAVPRIRVGINVDVLTAELKQVCRALVGAKPLLRIYWYETGTQNRTLSTEQLRICENDEFKLRLVSLHPQNVKTGTATAISRDLIELSRKGAISDALIVARNDTLRHGIEVSQSYGVRIHMLEVFAREDAKFSWLRTDTDTSRSWGSDVLDRFLYLNELPAESPNFSTPLRTQRHSFETSAPFLARRTEPAVSDETVDSIHAVVKDYIEELYDDELESCLSYWRTGRGVPNNYDKSLLFECRNVLDRNLSENERQVMRNSFRTFVEEKMRSLEELQTDDEPKNLYETDEDDAYEEYDGDDYDR